MISPIGSSGRVFLLGLIFSVQKVPELKTMPPSQPIDFSLMGNPFAEKLEPTPSQNVVEEAIEGGEVNEIVEFAGPPVAVPPIPQPIQADMTNPLAEVIEFTHSLNISQKLCVERAMTSPSVFLQMSASKILKIEKGRVFPVKGIDPFNVLCPLVVPTGKGRKVQEMDVSYLNMMRQLYRTRDEYNFEIILSSFFKKTGCEVCKEAISSSSDLVKHIMEGKHAPKNYKLESFAFWMYALLLAQKDSPWKVPYLVNAPLQSELVHTSVVQLPRFESNRPMFPPSGIDPFDVLCLVPAPYGKVDDKASGYALQLRSLFRKRCPSRLAILVGHLFVEQELRCAVCKINIACAPSQLIEHIMSDSHARMMAKEKCSFPIGALSYWISALRMVDASVVQIPKFDPSRRMFPTSGIDPFDVLSFVAAPYCKVDNMLRSLFKELCQSRFTTLVGHLFVEKELRCFVCRVKIACDPIKLIDHIMSKGHAKKLKEGNWSFPIGALQFWINALRMADATNSCITPVEENGNRDDKVGGMANPTSPLALLTHFQDVPHPCPDYAGALKMLNAKMRQCDVNKFNEAMLQYFGETLQCRVCFFECNLIHNSCQFISHITSRPHIACALRNCGRASKTALRFWLDALCSAGAVILPREEEQVMMLFDEK